jgi:hypothetical protein
MCKETVVFWFVLTLKFDVFIRLVVFCAQRIMVKLQIASPPLSTRHYPHNGL